MNEYTKYLELGAFSVSTVDGMVGKGQDSGLNLDLISFPALSQVNDSLGASYSLLLLSPQCLHLENVGGSRQPPTHPLLGVAIFLGKVFEVREPLEG